jgi:hypothetical protein
MYSVTEMNAKRFATEVVDQLGGQEFLNTLQAPTLTIDLNIWKRSHLLITLPPAFVANPLCCDGTVNNILVQLGSNNLYLVTFYKRRGCEWNEVATIEGVYCDMLKDIITKYAGLKVTLPEVDMEETCGFIPLD